MFLVKSLFLGYNGIQGSIKIRDDNDGKKQMLIQGGSMLWQEGLRLVRRIMQA